MKVHLIKTPEYESERFDSVCELLSSFDGPMQFIQTEFEFDINQFHFLQKFYPDFGFKLESNLKKIIFSDGYGFPLSWRELFSLCEHYRDENQIDENDFVVLLTDRKNDLNWFSSFDNRNAFIHTGDWEHFTDANPRYPIAYEVVENVMQSLMNIDLTDLQNNFIHKNSKGCMNDLCQNKTQIILKLQTANICKDCILKIRLENISEEILIQVRKIFNGIRNEFIFQTEDKPIEPIPLIVDRNGKILFPEQNIEMRLNPLFKTVYIFYLQHTEGIRLTDLNDFKGDLLSLYQRFSVADNNETIEARINDLVDPFGGSFSQKKSKLNRIITDLLGEPLAQFYRIEGNPGEPFKINLPQNLIDIRY